MIQQDLLQSSLCPKHAYTSGTQCQWMLFWIHLLHSAPVVRCPFHESNLIKENSKWSRKLMRKKELKSTSHYLCKTSSLLNNTTYEKYKSKLTSMISYPWKILIAEDHHTVFSKPFPWFQYLSMWINEKLKLQHLKCNVNRKQQLVSLNVIRCQDFLNSAQMLKSHTHEQRHEYNLTLDDPTW